MKQLAVKFRRLAHAGDLALPSYATSGAAGADLAAASIAQVHRATLCDGREVAVKLLRPDIEKHMLADTALFYSLAQILQWLAPGLRRLHLVTAVKQFKQLSEMELDLRLEAAAAGRLANNMRDDEGIYVPWVMVKSSVSLFTKITAISPR
jgi:ubiquinone biosynthesis protein